MTDWSILSPAYGRDYKSKAAVEADFRAGKDFKIHTIGSGSTYCSIRDFQKGHQIELRYNRMQSVHCITV